MKTKHLAILTIPILLLMHSCVVPDSRYVEPTFYLLGSIDGDKNETDFDSDYSFYLKGIELPKYLDDSRMIFRPNEIEIKFRENHRWGEPLEEGIARSIGLYLGKELKTLKYSVYPNRRKSIADMDIFVSVQNFEKVSADKVRLRATIDLSFMADGAKVFSFDEYFLVRGNGGESQEVRAMDQALHSLAKAIARNKANSKQISE